VHYIGHRWQAVNAAAYKKGIDMKNLENGISASQRRRFLAGAAGPWSWISQG
jgi:hypothetical protein